MSDSLESLLHNLLKSAFLEALQEHQLAAPPAELKPTNGNASVASGGLLTIADVAEWLAISDRQVHKLTRNEGLPCLKIGRLVRYDADSVRAWLAEQGGPEPGLPTPARRTTPRKAAVKKETRRSDAATPRPPKKAGNRRPQKASRKPSAHKPTPAEEERPPSRLQLLAESLGVDYAALGPVTNGDVRQAMGVDIPTCHSWTYLNRDLPEEAMDRLKDWLLSFKDKPLSGDMASDRD